MQGELFLRHNIAQAQVDRLKRPFCRHRRGDRQHLAKHRRADLKPIHCASGNIDQVIGPKSGRETRNRDAPLTAPDKD